MNGSDKMTMEQLSARERHTLDHLRQAEELGVSLEYYASAYNLEVKDLSSVRQQLVRKGLIAAEPPKGQEKSGAEKKSAGFAPVRVVSSPVSPALTCRLQHPSGWSIECSSVPEVSWIRALVSGVAA